MRKRKKLPQGRRGEVRKMKTQRRPVESGRNSRRNGKIKSHLIARKAWCRENSLKV